MEKFNFVYIINDKYIEKLRTIVDKRIELNRGFYSRKLRPRVFLFEEVVTHPSDPSLNIYKCYSLTSAKSNKRYCKKPTDRITKLPKECLFSLDEFGCVLLNNPIYVPKCFTEKIYYDKNTNDLLINKNSRIFEEEAKIINMNFDKFKEKIELLWDEQTKDKRIQHAQKYCVDAYLSYQVCRNEIKAIEQEKNKQPIQEQTDNHEQSR